MSTWAIFWVGLFALLAFGRLVSEAGLVLRAHAGRDQSSTTDPDVTLVPGNIVELPPGAEVRTFFSAEGIGEVSSAFEDAPDAYDIGRAKGMLASGSLVTRLKGERLMLRVNLRRAQRGLPALGCE
ncbi:hypothetical protein LPC10_17735 [Methylorubrum sp. B1-46]|uniref:hypothetical protein n=1 Tax=Methylorubrum TaxID=2282523 RepID=UPI001E48E9D9|nr:MULTISPECIES: hypothetical protein [Methylorubrum]MCG5246866.1 hypothetical protein [Methylorubrum extorquens]UGB24772.1 hypothetical protein LPC10_17735 [Methylorubrum sp. B1-46]